MASLSEELGLWVWRKYGALDDETLMMAVRDMNKIARGLHVERWGCPFEVIK